MRYIEYFWDWAWDQIVILVLFVVPAIALFWLIKNHVIPYLFKAPIRRRQVLHRLYQIKIIFWTVTLLVYIGFYGKTYPIGTLTLIAVIGASSFQIIRNLIQGIQLRFEGKVQLDDRIVINETTGRISNFYWTKLELIDHSENIQLLPYSNFEKNGFQIMSAKKAMDKEQFIFTLDKSLFTEAEIKMRNYLQTNPWILSDRGIEIEYKDGLVNIYAQLIEKKMRPKIKAELKRILKSISQ